MIRLELAVDRCGPLLRAAVVEDGRLCDLQVDRCDRECDDGAIFLGRVTRVVPALAGAFIDLGTGRPGFLGATDARGRGPRADPTSTRFGDGQTVLVQIKAAGSANKGPTLTTDITLPGRFLIHTPLSPGIAISRRLAQGAARAALNRRIRDLVPAEGWVVRSAAAEAADQTLAEEAESLVLAWREIAAAAATAAAPIRLAAGPSAVNRALIEYGGRQLTGIVIDDDLVAREIEGWCRTVAKDLVPILRRHRDPRPLFDLLDLEAEIEHLRRPRVELARGGWLMIEPTEALVAIDVNGGERGNPIDINLDAAREVARQLRLRNLGGIIVVDFISMKRRDDGERLLSILADAVAGDPVQTQVYGLSKLGLVEITRARRGRPVADLIEVKPNLRGGAVESKQ